MPEPRSRASGAHPCPPPHPTKPLPSPCPPRPHVRHPAKSKPLGSAAVHPTTLPETPQTTSYKRHFRTTALKNKLGNCVFPGGREIASNCAVEIGGEGRWGEVKSSVFPVVERFIKTILSDAMWSLVPELLWIEQYVSKHA